MIIPNQFIEVRWHYTNKDFYISKGYVFTKFNDIFFVKAEDMNPTSHIKIKIKCDHCDKVFMRSFRDYIKEHDDEYGDCCRVHNRLKAMKTCKEKYGVDWVLQNNDFKEKQKDTCRKKYGVDYISQFSGFREKVIKSVQSKYGVYNVSQIPEVREKIAKTFSSNGTCPTSKPQIKLNNMLNNIYGNSIINYPLGKYCLDSFLEVDGVKINVEYDGIFWHKNKEEKDNERDNYVLNKGIKILRILSNYNLPEESLLKKLIKELVESEKTFIKITI